MDRNALIRALRNTAQSASNAIASNVSGPVDLIAAGLRGVGLPIPQNPVGGSQWMAEKGLTAPVQQGVAQVIGDTIGLAGPALVANFAPQIAGALNRGAQNLAAPRTLRPETGAIVWHGSPHQFDRFDSSKIGTGEGAQAYGHGLYLAESPDVATGYMNTLAGNASTKGAGYYPKINGKVVYDDFEDLDLVRQIAAATEPKAGGLMGRGSRPSVSSDVAISELIAKNKAIANDLRYFPEARAEAENQINALSRYLGKNIESSRPSLYKVDLPDEQIARMLDWDKPLSQQAPEVQRAAAMFGPKAGELTGQELYKKAAGFDPMVNVASKIGGDESVLRRFFPKATDAQIAQAIAASKRAGANDAIAAQMLRDAGIPGIRYLDGGSRGVGQGTSNFVVFPGNENILQILERNGQPLGLMGVR